MAELTEVIAPVRAWVSRAWAEASGLLQPVDPTPVDKATTRRILARPALLGFLATLAITFGASQPDSPFALKQPGAWFFGVSGSHSEGLLGVVAVYGGMLLLIKTWYGLSRTLHNRPGVRLLPLVGVFVLWILPLLIAPPLFSRDAYSYAAQGEMVSHHINPYDYGPYVLGDNANPYTMPVDQLWGLTPAPYGPLFLGTAGAITDITAHDELATVVGMRVLAILGVGLIAFFVPKLARRFKRDPSEAFALAVLNPLTLLHLIGGAHNDALMVGLLVAGIVLSKQGRPIWGIVACSMAAAVKVPALIGVVYIGWEWVGAEANWRQRIRPLVSAVLVSSGVMSALSIVTGLGWGWMRALGTPGTVRSLIAPFTAVGVLFGNIFHAVGIGPSQQTTLTLARGTGLLVAAAVAVGLLWYSARIGYIKALSLSLLAFVVLGPVVQPWYLAWGLILLAPVASGRLRAMLLWLSIVASFIGMPGLRVLIDELGRASAGSVVICLIVLVAIPSMPLASWGRRALERMRSPGVQAS